MTEKFEYCHRFYDPVADYMEQLCHDKYITENFKGSHDPVVGYVEKQLIR